MLTTISARALLAQGSLQQPEEKIMKVKVLRGFWIEKELMKPGTMIEIHEGLVRELLSSQKIEMLPDGAEFEEPVKAATESESNKEE